MNMSDTPTPTPARVVTRLRSHTFIDRVDWDTLTQLGLDDVKQGSQITCWVDLNLREKDELLAATLVACLRRLLPALVERCEQEARERVFPGDVE